MGVKQIEALLPAPPAEPGGVISHALCDGSHCPTVLAVGGHVGGGASTCLALLDAPLTNVAEKEAENSLDGDLQVHTISSPFPVFGGSPTLRTIMETAS